VTAEPLPDRPVQPQKWTTQELDPVRVRHLVCAGTWVAARWGLDMRRRAIRRLVLRFLHEGHADAEFRTWFLAYADPTGETAVRNVMRQGEGGQRR